MRIPLWLKLVWTACVIAWIPLHWRQYVLQNFLFFCDLGNLFIAAAMWLESAPVFLAGNQPSAFSDPLHYRSGRRSGKADAT
jgi:hypothetical protein